MRSLNLQVQRHVCDPKSRLRNESRLIVSVRDLSAAGILTLSIWLSVYSRRVKAGSPNYHLPARKEGLDGEDPEQPVNFVVILPILAEDQPSLDRMI